MKHVWVPPGKRFGSAGQSLVEAIVIIGITVLLSTGVIAATTASLRVAQTGRTRTQAVTYAQEGIELIRKIRDEDWSVFQSYDGLYCLGSNQTLVSSSGCSTNITTPQGSFTRSVQFTWQNPRMVVTVTVSYPDGSGTRDTNLTTYMTEWK